MKRLICHICLVVFIIALYVSGHDAEHTRRLQPGLVAPPRISALGRRAVGALGKEAKDIPTLTPYFAPPAKATGASFVICRRRVCQSGAA